MRPLFSRWINRFYWWRMERRSILDCQPGEIAEPAGAETCRIGAGRHRAAVRMTSFKQIEANRRNAFKSSGPTSTDGKQASRRNALRHLGQ